MRLSIEAVALIGRCLVNSQQVAQDPGTSGPPLEIVQFYNDLYPQGKPSHLQARYASFAHTVAGVAVSSTGRKFSSYARALDPNNTAYIVAELTGVGTDTPFPSADFNSPLGGAINYSVSSAVGANYQDRLIGAQSVVVDPLERLWIVDTGRATMENHTVVPASVGGAKLTGVDLATNKTFKTIVFPANVVYPDSYINDIRFDLRKSIPGFSGTDGVT